MINVSLMQTRSPPRGRFFLLKNRTDIGLATHPSLLQPVGLPELGMAGGRSTSAPSLQCLQECVTRGVLGGEDGSRYLSPSSCGSLSHSLDVAELPSTCTLLRLITEKVNCEGHEDCLALMFMCVAVATKECWKILGFQECEII